MSLIEIVSEKIKASIESLDVMSKQAQNLFSQKISEKISQYADELAQKGYDLLKTRFPRVANSLAEVRALELDRDRVAFAIILIGTGLVTLSIFGPFIVLPFKLFPMIAYAVIVNTAKAIALTASAMIASIMGIFSLTTGLGMIATGTGIVLIGGPTAFYQKTMDALKVFGQSLKEKIITTSQEFLNKEETQRFIQIFRNAYESMNAQTTTFLDKVIKDFFPAKENDVNAAEAPQGNGASVVAVNHKAEVAGKLVDNTVDESAAMIAAKEVINEICNQVVFSKRSQHEEERTEENRLNL